VQVCADESKNIAILKPVTCASIDLFGTGLEVEYDATVLESTNIFV